MYLPADFFLMPSADGSDGLLSGGDGIAMGTEMEMYHSGMVGWDESN